MRWKPKEIQEPKQGDTRVVKHLALTPVLLMDGYKAWLEVVDQYEEFQYRDGILGYGQWVLIGYRARAFK